MLIFFTYTSYHKYYFLASSFKNLKLFTGLYKSNKNVVIIVLVNKRQFIVVMFWYNTRFNIVRIKNATNKIKYLILNDLFFLYISLSLSKDTFLPFSLKISLIVEFAIKVIMLPKIIPTTIINRYEYGK